MADVVDTNGLEFRVLMLEELCKQQSKIIDQLSTSTNNSPKGSIQTDMLDKASLNAHSYLHKGVPFPQQLVNVLYEWKNRMLH